ncbi:MAG: phage head closure protein [Proteobacteria bacterium]|nr:phage head closure protein [Pseudomonadota bacterium]
MSAIGEFREKLSLQEETRVADTGGGASLSWSEVASVWGAVEPLSGHENIQGEGLSSVQLYKILLRYRGELGVSMRVVWDSRVLNIRSLREVDARGRLLEILAEEGVAT